ESAPQPTLQSSRISRSRPGVALLRLREAVWQRMRWGDVERNCAAAISPVPEKLSSNDLDVPIEVRRKPSRFGPSTERAKKWQHGNVDVRQGHMGISRASVRTWQPSQIKCANRATTRRWKKSQA